MFEFVCVYAFFCMLLYRVLRTYVGNLSLGILSFGDFKSTEKYNHGQPQ